MASKETFLTVDPFTEAEKVPPASLMSWMISARTFERVPVMAMWQFLRWLISKKRENYGNKTPVSQNTLERNRHAWST